MQEEIKCPQCNGNKFKELGRNEYRCMYCKTTFTHKSKYDQNKVQDTQNVTQPSPSIQTPSEATVGTGHPYITPSYHAYRGGKSKTIAGILAIFLGAFGAHHFYLRRTGLGILYLIFFWTWIPSFIAFIEGIVYLCMSDREFDQKYNY